MSNGDWERDDKTSRSLKNWLSTGVCDVTSRTSRILTPFDASAFSNVLILPMHFALHVFVHPQIRQNSIGSEMMAVTAPSPA
jgi:hypothetical protein